MAQSFAQRLASCLHLHNPRALRTARRHPFRPLIAVLEDRCVPSTLTVTSGADDASQPHTLRYAVTHARSGDTILLTAAIKGPIVLDHGELVLDRDLTIRGVPGGSATISGGGASRVFQVTTGAHVELKNLTITGGNGRAANPSVAEGFDGIGGGILNQAGTLTITDCTIAGDRADAGGGGIFTFPGTTTNITGTSFSGDAAGFGGAISNAGVLSIAGGAFRGNTAWASNGGALDSIGDVTIADATFSGNSAAFAGGAISDGGRVWLYRVAFSGNSAFVGGAISTIGTEQINDASFTSNVATFGGAISAVGNVQITGGTFSGNIAWSVGGAISNAGQMVVLGSQFESNSAGLSGGAISNAGTLSVGRSRFSRNQPDNINSPYTDLGGNQF